MDEYGWPPTYEGMPLRFRKDARQEMLEFDFDWIDILEVLHEGDPCGDERAEGVLELCYKEMKVVVRKEWNHFLQEDGWLVIDVGRPPDA